MTTAPMMFESPFNPPVPREDAKAMARHQAAMRALLEEGQHFTTATPHQVTAEELRGWHDRLRWVTLALVDYFEAPARAAVLALLSSPHLDDDEPCLRPLRENIAGASYNDLGAEVGVTGNTLRRLEDGTGCNIGTSKKIADRFGLRTTEMFKEGTEGERSVPVTVRELRKHLEDGDG